MRPRNNTLGSRAALVLPGILSLLTLVGCGGSDNASPSLSKAPTAATRALVRSLQGSALQSLGSAGVPSASLALVRGNAADSAAGGGSASAPVSASTSTAFAPMTGAFLNNAILGARLHGFNGGVTGANVSRKASRLHRKTRRVIASHLRGRTRDADDGGNDDNGDGGDNGNDGSGVDDPVFTTGVGGGTSADFPTFYYDEYLGLWTQYAEAASKITYTLYVDEAKTKPAGSIVLNIPAENATQQTFSSTYTYTAGTQKGAHGQYTWVLSADQSGHSSYENVYADGSGDSGQSSFTSAGEYQWTSNTRDAQGATSRDTGVFHANGSGTTHSERSDGFVTDTTFNTDGSGRSRLLGPAAGLPATTVWDTEGHYTVTYADGTTETWNLWDTIEPVGGTTGGGVADGGTSSSGISSSPIAAK